MEPDSATAPESDALSVGIVTNDILATKLHHLTVEMGLHAIRYRDVRQVADTGEQIRMLLFQARTAEDSDARALRALAAIRPEISLVMLAIHTLPEWMEQIPGLVGTVVLPAELHTLPSMIIRGHLSSSRRHLLTLLREATSLHPLLRSLLRTVFEQRIRANRQSRTSPPGRSITALAPAIGASPAYLRRLHSNSPIDVRKTAEHWQAVQALIHHEALSESWSTLAFRLGYKSVSGFSDLMVRVFDCRPSQLRGTNVLAALRNFEQMVEGALKNEA